MTCLLFAGLLMLIGWLPNRQGASVAGGTGGGVGAGTGNAVGDGTSSSDDASGDNDRTVTGETDPSTDDSAGRDGLGSGVDAKADDSGHVDLETAKDDSIAGKGKGSVDAQKSPHKCPSQFHHSNDFRTIHQETMAGDCAAKCSAGRIEDP